MVLLPQIPLITNLPLIQSGSSSDLEQLNARSHMVTKKTSYNRFLVKIKNFNKIHSRRDLMDSDYKTIKKNLIKAAVKPHLNIFYSIEMGLQGKSWNEITSNEKNEIKKILEGVK